MYLFPSIFTYLRIAGIYLKMMDKYLEFLMLVIIFNLS